MNRSYLGMSTEHQITPYSRSVAYRLLGPAEVEEVDSIEVNSEAEKQSQPDNPARLSGGATRQSGRCA
ncbi:hypothetical protein M6D81_05310 [Paenibacillus sp. J5C_2022]|uniref:hypothetical protein n=1 Tax=Paenibacillus sp. J5C2022 TaxID=2977129 RepID=UPI0021CDF3D9|nr:hypothetical protein [Paenibacillus sp. J5C2022]MCU6708123.1 hypothetical protein [Paenibacillus sp. J5C2022]